MSRCRAYDPSIRYSFSTGGASSEGYVAKKVPYDATTRRKVPRRVQIAAAALCDKRRNTVRLESAPASRVKSRKKAFSCVCEAISKRISKIIPPIENALLRHESLPPPLDAESERSWAREVGLALFLPLGRQQQPPQKMRTMSASTATLQDEDSSDTTIDSADRNDSDSSPMHLLDAPDLASIPCILKQHQMEFIRHNGLPPTVQLMAWQRAYSLERDGDSFVTMLRNVAHFSNTLIVIKTHTGDILGGFADTPWARQERTGVLHRSRSFYGGGRSFLFATNAHGSSDSLHNKSLSTATAAGSMEIFKWTGKNTYSQVCDVDAGLLAMGGGGEFGFILQDDFTVGSTGPCATFGNPALTKGFDGKFHVVDLEVYGFHPFLDRSSVVSTLLNSPQRTITSMFP